MSAITRRLAATLCLTFFPGHVLSQEPFQPPLPEKTGYKFTFLERKVDYRMPEWGVVRGKLDKEGTFIPDSLPAQKPSVLTGYPVYPALNLVAINDRRRHPNEIGTPLDQAPQSEEVYEYRSGVLIPGQLLVGGYFRPHPGAKIIPFAEYVPGLGANRIYNLPGEFVPIKK
jgi:hypothetical protein